VNTGTLSAHSHFWDQFDGIVPEAVRCRFFSTASAIADARAKEYRRESGSFLSAVESTHLPGSLRRLSALKREFEVVSYFYGDDYQVKHADRRRASEFIEEAAQIVASFEEQIVVPLVEVVKRQDEGYAREVIMLLKQAAEKIRSSAQASFERAVEELEEAVVRSVVFVGPLEGFVSCVSLDLFRYGTYARRLHDLIEARGVEELNRRIQRQIDAAIKDQGIPLKDVVKIETGDGAILIFKSNQADGIAVLANRAYGFSSAFLSEIAKENDRKHLDEQLHFRIGICSGTISGEHSRIRRMEIVQCRVGGIPLGVAVTLQSAAATGQILACEVTRNALPSEVQEKFGESQLIHGKPHEPSIQAYRYQCVPSREDATNPRAP
jgi:class 3 adenylate cyclase